MSKKYVYLFSEGDASMRNLLGGKGANLAEMTTLGLPVPQGFTISTEACTKYYEDGKTIDSSIVAEIYEAIAKTEEIAGKKIWRSGKSFLGFRAFGRSGFHAWNDGYDFEPGPERCCC